MTRRTSCALISLLFCFPWLALAAQHDSDPWSEDRWGIYAAEAAKVDYLGQQALRLMGGVALLKDQSVTDGVIEFDLAIAPDRGFVGGIFRAQDTDNFEHFYVRPHQSGNPDANQYTPVMHGISGWQLYHGEGYAVPIEYPFHQWMHIKIVFAGKFADIYIDSEEPVLRVADLKRPIAAGAVGVIAPNAVASHFANFSLSELPSDYVFAQATATPPEPSPGIVRQWQVSDAFDDESLAEMFTLSESMQSDRSWTAVKAEATGIANLAQVQGVSEDTNTAFARVTVHSERAQTRLIQFGYSDAVSVYVNGKLHYRGSNLYRSRDYRYLGTMGWFDALAVPLEAGDNEIWFAVSEAFGGWGVMARFPESDGLSIP